MNKEAAWRLAGMYMLAAAQGPEEELTVIDALQVMASGLGIEDKAVLLSRHAMDLRRVNATRLEVRDFFSGQMNLPLDGKDGQSE